VRANIVGFASDGASVMLGENNGLLQKFKAWKGKNIYGIHCMAHMFQLAIRKPMDRFDFMNIFETFVNDIYKFYGGHGHKNKAHLEEFANAYDEAILNYNYIFKVRCISSEMTAMKKIFTTWSLLSRHFKSIIDPRTSRREFPSETQFSASTKQTAIILHRKLIDRHYVLLLAFLLDVLNLLAMESKAMQKRDAIVIGQNSNKVSFINSLMSLKSKNGHYTSHVLSNSACSNIENQLTKYLWNGVVEPNFPTGTDGCRDVKNFEKSPHIVFKGEKLSTVDSSGNSRNRHGSSSQHVSDSEMVPALSTFKNFGRFDFFLIKSNKIFGFFFSYKKQQNFDKIFSAPSS
jgi:hypothetical protein